MVAITINRMYRKQERGLNNRQWLNNSENLEKEMMFEVITDSQIERM